MIGLIFFFIVAIYLYVDYCKEDADRKRYRDEAKAAGKDYYQDFWGKWWYKNRRVSWHINDGHEVLTSPHNRNIVYVDLTVEKDVVSLERVKEFLKKEQLYKLKEEKKGVRYYNVINDLTTDIAVDIKTDKFLFMNEELIEGELVPMKYYYERVWDDSPSYRWKCVNKERITKDELLDFRRTYDGIINEKDVNDLPTTVGSIDRRKHSPDSWWYHEVA